MSVVASQRYMFLQVKTNTKTIHLQQERKEGMQHKIPLRLDFE